MEAAVAELNYVPNTIARSLRLKQTHTLALVLTDIFAQVSGYDVAQQPPHAGDRAPIDRAAAGGWAIVQRKSEPMT